MNLVSIRQAVRDLINEQDSSATGVLFPADNAFLDRMISLSAELVELDLADHLPTDFLDYEVISLQADVDKYRLSRPYTRIVAIKNNLTGDTKHIIPYYDTLDDLVAATAGESGDPRGWSLKGEYIYFLPKPSGDVAGFAKCWFITTEPESMGAAGPRVIPEKAHKLVAMMACILIAKQQESDSGPWEQLYAYTLDRVRKILGAKVQQQPRFMRASADMRFAADTRDPTQYDTDPYFSR